MDISGWETPFKIHLLFKRLSFLPNREMKRRRDHHSQGDGVVGVGSRLAHPLGAVLALREFLGLVVRVQEFVAVSQGHLVSKGSY